MKNIIILEDRRWNNQGIIFRGEVDMEDEAQIWVHKNTPFSYHEATTNQGYVVLNLNSEKFNSLKSN